MIVEGNLHRGRHFRVRWKLSIWVLAFEATSGDLVPKLVRSLARASEAALEPLEFLVGVHDPPLPLRGVFLLLLSLFRLLSC